jgi:UDP-D-galactose:(glucosyl)LPS alpha-1,3-D-galactosyltransferase
VRSRPYDIVVAAAADSLYAWQAVLALVSAGTLSTASTFCLMLGDRLHADFPAEAASQFERFRIPFRYEAPDLSEFDSFPTGYYLSRAAYARLRIPEIAAPFARKTLYLDSDTLVTRDLAPLAAVALGRNAAAAVRSRWQPTFGSPGGAVDWLREGIVAEAPFFNSGVLLIDNDRWERLAVSAQVEAHIRRSTAKGYLDQDSLNVTLHDQWAELPWFWNFQIERAPNARLGSLIVSRHYCVRFRQIGILHYLTHLKPWHLEYPPGYFASTYRRAWMHFLPVTPPESQTYGEWFIRRLAR